MERPTAQEVAKVMSSFVNGGGSNKRFVDAMAGEHRTLQQLFTKLCVAWFLNLADRTGSEYDPRNEASVMLAIKIKEILLDNPLPLI